MTMTSGTTGGYAITLGIGEPPPELANNPIFCAVAKWEPKDPARARTLEVATSEHSQFLKNAITLRILEPRDSDGRHSIACVAIPRAWIGRPATEFQSALHAVLDNPGTFGLLHEGDTFPCFDMEPPR